MTDTKQVADLIAQQAARIAGLEDALRTIVIHKSSVQLDPQWAVHVARNALGSASVHGTR